MFIPVKTKSRRRTTTLGATVVLESPRLYAPLCSYFSAFILHSQPNITSSI